MPVPHFIFNEKNIIRVLERSMRSKVMHSQLYQITRAPPTCIDQGDGSLRFTGTMTKDERGTRIEKPRAGHRRNSLGQVPLCDAP